MFKHAKNSHTKRSENTFFYKLNIVFLTSINSPKEVALVTCAIFKNKRKSYFIT